MVRIACHPDEIKGIAMERHAFKKMRL